MFGQNIFNEIYILMYFTYIWSVFQGLRKRDLLQEVLPVIGENLRFQRLFTEYQDQLELLRNK